MNLPRVKTIYLKELSDILRDRRTLFAMVGLPLLLYPVIMLFVMQMLVLQVERLGRGVHTVAVEAPHGLPLVAALEASEGLTVVRAMEGEGSRGPAQAAVRVAPGFEEGLAAGEPQEVVVESDLSDDGNWAAVSRVKAALEAYQGAVVRDRLRARGLDESLLQPFAVRVRDRGAGDSFISRLIARVVPYFVILILLVGAIYPAIDLTAGEKERGTIETLLVTPASRLDIVAGKYLTVLTMCLGATLINLASMFLTTRSAGTLMSSPALGVSLSPTFLLGVLVLLLPLAALLSAAAMAVAAWARGFREAQNYVTPLIMAVMVPSLATFLPGFDLTPVTALLPPVNVALLCQTMMAGSYPWLEMGLAFGSTLLLAMLALRFTVHLFEREGMLVPTVEEPVLGWRALLHPRPHPGVPATRQVLALFLVQLALLYHLGVRWQTRDLLVGLLLTELLLFLLPVLALCRLGGFPLPRALGLCPARPRAWASAALMGGSLWVISATLLWLQNQVAPYPETYRQVWEQFASVIHHGGFGLLVIALVAPVCEELVFRGVALRSAARGLGPVNGILLSGLLFAVIHLDPYRLVPLAFTGVMFAYLAWQSGSVLPAVLAHMLNNLVPFLIMRLSPLQPTGGEIALPPPGPLLLGVAALVLALILLRGGIGSKGAGGSDAR